MKRNGQRRGSCDWLAPIVVVTVLSSAFSAVTLADVTLDGTLGTAGAVAGPDYRIPASVGQQVGGNLFHSFGRFTVDTGESATFSGPASIERVIGRVTGGQASWIDGSLRNEIPRADLYLLNPAGVLFGPNASLDVGGAFHVSTADFLRLGEDGRFDASQPESTLLTSTPPSAFGFMGENPAAISVRSGDSETADGGLTVPPGQTLSLVGGALSIRGGVLSAPAGQLQIASIASRGEVIVTAAGLETSTIAERGNILVSDHSSLDVSGEGGGRLMIRAGQLVIEGQSEVEANTLGGIAGREIDIEVDDLTVRDSFIASTTRGDGAAGDVRIKADGISLRDGAAMGSVTFAAGRGGNVSVAAGQVLLSGDGALGLTGIISQSTGSGDGGGLSIAAESLEIRNGAAIRSSTFDMGNGGELSVSADRIFLSGDEAFALTGISADSFGNGDAGRLTVRAGDLEVRNGSVIATAAFGAGRAGDLQVVADRVFTSEDGASVFTGLTSQAAPGGSTGDAGNLTLQAGILEVRNGAEISASTFGAGRGGELSVTADHIFLSDDGSPEFTGITSAATPDSTGDAGNLTVTAGTLEVRNGAEIRAATFSSGDGGDLRVTAERILLSGDGVVDFTGIGANAAPGGSTGDAGDLSIEAGSLTVRDGAEISASTFGTGRGGNLQISADSVLLSGDRSGLFFTGIAATSRCETCGDAGSIALQTDQLRLQDNASISTATVQAGGGSIEIQAQDLVTLIESAITTSVAGGDDNAGNISITPPVVLTLVEGSRIEANAFEGTGGSVRIVADSLIQSPDSVIEASSQLGIDGVVELNAPDTDISGSLLGLPATFLDPTTIMRRPCVERSAADAIRFVVRRYEVLPDSPYALRVPLPAGRPAVKDSGRASGGHDAGIPRWSIRPVSTCSGDA